MDDLSHWKFAESFSIDQAAWLIMGVDPNLRDDGSQFPTHIGKKLRLHYSLAMEWMRREAEFMFLSQHGQETHQSPFEGLASRDQALWSVQMQNQLDGVKTTSDVDQIWNWCTGPFMLDNPVFSSCEIDRWLKVHGLPSAFAFGGEEWPSQKDELQDSMDARERVSHLNIIGALLSVIDTKEGALIAELLSRFPGKYGISKRNLEGKFADAKRSLSAD